jgi:putative redox protein
MRQFSSERENMIKTVKVNSIWKGDMRIDSQARNHAVIIDQLPADQGPNPMEYLLFALGGCLGTLASIVSRQERIDLRGFSVEMEGDYDPDFLFARTQEGRAGFSDIRVVVNIDADMTDEEKQAFFEKIDCRCPITDNLMNGVGIQFFVK